MAVITSFKPLQRERALKLQPTHVLAHFGSFERDGRRFIQIDTFGSEARENADKQSQTIQLTRDSAEQLWKILSKEFGFSS